MRLCAFLAVSKPNQVCLTLAARSDGKVDQLGNRRYAGDNVLCGRYRVRPFIRTTATEASPCLWLKHDECSLSLKAPLNYVSPSTWLVAHETCLLSSSGLVARGVWRIWAWRHACGASYSFPFGLLNIWGVWKVVCVTGYDYWEGRLPLRVWSF